MLRKITLAISLWATASIGQAQIPISQVPLLVSQSAPPLNMLVMGRDHKLYYEAYNDASDLDGDGIIDAGYKPSIDYYGYFDSNRCYSYSTSDNLFNPEGPATDKKCSGQWSGDYLNYLTTSRMDALRKVLYGGYRATDTATETILERSHIPQDAHSWGKEYRSEAHDGYRISDYTPLEQPTGTKRHLFANTTLRDNESWGPRLRYITNSTFRIWEWVSIEQPVAGSDCVRGSDNSRRSCGTITDRRVRVAVCVDGKLEANCTTYPNGNSKPTGILHDFGEADRMYFGLLTGSYEQNTAGGTLRSNMASFSEEIDENDGRFIKTDGIVATINNLKTIEFSTGRQYNVNCGWITNGPISDGQCSMWGNPIGEMMYETMRYFAGESGPHITYDIGNNAKDSYLLSLPKPDWISPYKTSAQGGGDYPACAIPVMTVVSDINPSYDFKLPGSHWSDLSASGTSSIAGLNVSTEVDAIWSSEGGGSRSIFIGESNDVADSAPTAKIVSNLSTVRGLAPEEPSKQGTYYSAGVARFGANTKIGGDKEMMTYTVALASPLPKIEFPVGGNTVTVVPFAKSVGGSGISATSDFQPTNQIVDYYVAQIANTDPQGSDQDTTVNGGRPYAQFRINYEDVEQGADHDMDAIALYTLAVNASGQLDITLRSEYAAGGIHQYMGYAISGTTKDGVYLEICDLKDNRANDNTNDKASNCAAQVRYKLNTPPERDPGWCAIEANRTGSAECNGLPPDASRTFTPSNTPGATLLNNPLWYAAKYGMPRRNPASVDGDPDNYFLVTNATTLKDQLTKAFNDILQRNTSITSPVVEGNTTEDGSFIYRTDFKADGWTGDLIKEELKQVDGSSQLETIWRASEQLPTKGERNILFAPADGKGDLVEFSWENLENREFVGINLQEALNKPANGEADGLGENRVDYITENCSDANCADFRVPKSRLGDIINSSPVLAEGAQYLPYRAETLDGVAGAYRVFQNSIKDRPGIVYVGANDGMLHAFYSGTGVDADEAGKEVFAFIPTAVISNLNKLTDPQYGIEGGELHQYFVDGTPVVADVYFGDGEGDDKGWRTVLVGSLGAGGKAIFALDITDPEKPKLLWEFTDSAMGVSIPQPSIARLHSGQWAALIPNGYNSGTNPTLFALDIKTGTEIRRLTTLSDPDDLTTTVSTTGNGLSNIRTADMNGDGVVDYVYGGDQLGNVWRFDLYNVSAGNLNKCTTNCTSVKDQYQVSFGGKPLYVAQDADGNRLPITAAPTLLRHPTSIGHVVMVGTGRYLGLQDKNTSKKESLYGIWDRQTSGQAATTTPELSRSDLREQTLSADGTMQIGNETRPVRLITDHTVQWYNHEGLPDSDRCVPSNNEDSRDASVNCWGWRLDLTFNGERVVNNMQMYGEALIFSTITPSDDSCSSGLDGFTYAINPATGGRTYFNVFDLNGDGSVDTGDGKDGNVVSGFGNPAGDFTIHDGFLYSPDGKRIPVDHGSLAKGRQSWHLIPPPKPAAPSTPESGE